MLSTVAFITRSSAIIMVALVAVFVWLQPDFLFAGCKNNCRDFPQAGYPTHVEDADGDGFTIAQGDCDDLDPSEFPGQQWFRDWDNDGYSDGTSLEACLRPTSYKTSAELYLVTGDLNDQIPDPELVSLPVVNTLQPAMLSVNRQVTLNGSAFGSFQGSGYVNFYNNTRSAEIISWNDDTIVCQLPPAAQNGCVEIVTVYGKSNCLAYTVRRSLPWALLLTNGTGE